MIVSNHDATRLDLSEDPFWSEHLKDVLASRDEPSSIFVAQETPEFYRPDPTAKNVARIEWETSKIIDYDYRGNPLFNWVKQLNAMDEVWAASEFTRKVLQDSGVETDIEVIPHPVDLEMYSPGERTFMGMSRGKACNEDKFTALSAFQFTPRKNPTALLTAWSRSSLGKRDDCCLLLKTYGASFDNNSHIVNDIARFGRDLNIAGLKKNVFPLTSLVPEHAMPQLYRAADIFITTTRGEGFCLPVSEAAACGLPCIYTDATAHTEFAVGYPVKCFPEPVTGMPHIPWYAADQNWWTIDQLDLIDKLEEAYADWKSGKLRELGKMARMEVSRLHSDERVGKLIRERVRALTS